MAKAQDLGNFFRIPADNRDLNYDKYFDKGEIKTSALDDYNSHNTRRLDVKETEEILLGLEFIKNELKD